MDKRIVFAFEEIENNLHPALQRRVFQYLYDYAVDHNAKIFITSHSHIAKEIENYVAAEAVNKTYGCDLKQIEQFDRFPDYISKYDKNFSTHKVDAARKICEHITEENSESIFDLQDSIIMLYNEIKKWNNLE